MGLCQKHSEGGGVPKIYGRSILKRTFTNPLATTVKTPPPKFWDQNMDPHPKKKLGKF